MRALIGLFGFLLLCGTRVQADTIPGEFTIWFNNFQPGPNGDPIFSGTANTGLTVSGFTQNNKQICVGADCGIVHDPDIEIDLGGFSQGLTGNSIPPFAVGTGLVRQDFINESGSAYLDILLQTALSNFSGTVNFSCDDLLGQGLTQGPLAFTSCGFKEDFSGSVPMLDILFESRTVSGSGIATAVPEPSVWSMLMIVAVALATARFRKPAGAVRTLARRDESISGR